MDALSRQCGRFALSWALQLTHWWMVPYFDLSIEHVDSFRYHSLLRVEMMIMHVV